jgi:hypothetical protein
MLPLKGRKTHGNTLFLEHWERFDGLIFGLGQPNLLGARRW